MKYRRPLGALIVLSLSASTLVLPSGPSLAQTAAELEQQYRREAMEQALETREQYDLYGIHFDTDRASIRPGSEKLLDDIATALGNFPEWKLRIVGHTDATGDADLNRQLSFDRAIAVRGALEGRGVDVARLAAAGVGEDRPVARDDTDDGRALNRRVQLERVTDSPEGRELLKAMSDYMGAQDRLAVDYDASFEVVTHAGQKLALASSGTVSLDRPDAASDMLVLVVGGPFGDGLKSANSTLTVHLDGHPAYTARDSGISTTTADTNGACWPPVDAVQQGGVCVPSRLGR